MSARSTHSLRSTRRPRSTRRRLPRQGIALLLALGLITLIALIVAGAVASSTLAGRSSRLVATDAALTASADYALNSVLGNPQGFDLPDLAIGRTRHFTVPVPTSGVSATVAATRLPAGVLWLVASLWLGGLDSGARRVNLLARFPSLGPLPPAGVVTRGAVRATSADFGIDSTTDFDCSAAGAPAVVVAPGASASVPPGTVTATQPLATDSATYFLTARQLALLDSGSGVVHVRGDTVITGGSLAGILIVDGALAVAGPLTVSGLIVARGPIAASGTGLSVTGALMSYAADSTAVDLGAATIRYSPCAVARAFRVAAPAKRVHGRSWAELF
jgi:hypothetical protein